MNIDQGIQDPVDGGDQQPVRPDIQQQAPNIPPRQRAQHGNGLQFIRAPPILKLTMDLDTYLRRFQAYTNSIGAQQNELPHILINLLDDDVMAFIERHLVENITYDDLVQVLRRELGVARHNREDYKAKLRKTLRSRHEDVRSFYSKLWTLAKKAYPDNQPVRDANLRDVFVANFQDSQISTRLRENNELNNEQLLDLAVNLLNCKNASISRQSEVSASFTGTDGYNPGDDMQSSLGYRPPVSNVSAAAVVARPPSSIRPVDSSTISRVIDMLSNMNINGEGSPSSSNATPTNVVPPQQGQNYPTYRYQGNRRSIGLDQNYASNNYRRNQFRPSVPTRPQWRRRYGRNNFRRNQQWSQYNQRPGPRNQYPRYDAPYQSYQNSDFSGRNQNF